jgi:hypothetical protein
MKGISRKSGLNGCGSLFVALTIMSSSCALADDNSLADALRATKPLIDLRLRYEEVDQTPIAKNAEALTLRARLGFETGKAWQTSLLAEGEAVWPWSGNYRSDNAVARNTQYPVIADPESYELNRLQLSNTSLPQTTMTLGRQRINMDDQRFIGASGWRQNEQTFDAFRVINKSVHNLTLDAVYLNQVNRVYGPDSPQGKFRGDSYLANASYQFGIGKLTAFGYWLDFDPIKFVPAAPALDPSRGSTRTFGARFAGDQTVGKIKLSYAASYATQSDYASNPLSFASHYYAGELNVGYKEFSAGAGIESLQGNGKVGFATPLATLHKFQGWADKFLTTPADGIDDRYATVVYSTKRVAPFAMLSATVVYHDYKAERVSTDYGTETDLQLQARWKKVIGTLKYADYNATARTPVAFRDTSKFWAQLEYIW